jgi:hypothetical protein
MKTYTISIFLLLASHVAQGQNLVENGGFEEYTECPTSISQVDRAVGWSMVSGSPDYFNRCNENDSMGVPMNLLGYQEAYEGDAYMGCGVYSGGSGYRECFQHALAQPLMPGIPVYLSMRVSPGGFGNDPDGNNSARYASNGIGMKFSMQAHTTNSLWPGNVALQMTSILNDTASWTEVSGIYVPDSAYTFIAIGCFLPDSALAVQVIDPTGDLEAAYAFIDAVCVSPNSVDCPLSIGIREIPQPLWNIGPNPVGSELHLRMDGSLVREASLVLLDEAGRLVQRKFVANGTADIIWPLDGLANGSYYVQLQTSSGQYRPVHIVYLKP